MPDRQSAPGNRRFPRLKESCKLRYKRVETGEWRTGSARKQKVLTENEAIEYAREHRDQFQKSVLLLRRRNVRVEKFRVVSPTG